MKKIIYLLLVFGFVFSACEPLDDINSAIDAQDSQIVGDAEYTLTDDDYDALDLSYGSFNSEDDAKTEIPALLTEMYPVWGKNSSVLVGYNLYIGNAFTLKDYSLKQADYTLSGSDLLGFQSDATPEDYLADIIGNNYSYLKEGDYVAATYYQYTGSAYVVTPTVSIDENFDYGTTAGDLTTITTEWTAHSSYTPLVQYATTSLAMTDYPTTDIGGSVTIANPGGEDVNSEFTPITSGKIYASVLVNFSAVNTGDYFFHFIGSDVPYDQFRARVGAMSDGSEGILFGIGASSSTLTYGPTSFALNTTYLLVASYDLANGISNLYVLETVETTEPSTPEATNTGDSDLYVRAIAIRQDSKDGPTGTMDGVRVANTWSAIMSNDVLEDEVVGTKESYKAFYTYTDGVWEAPSSNFYALSEADFDSIGLSNFGSSTPPDSYLPTFLGLKFPYAQEGDELDVAYDYVSSSSGAQTRGNLYTKVNGAWSGYQSTISTTLQFGHDGNAWIPDNTIKYTLVDADYAYIAAELEGNPDFANVSLTNLAKYKDYDYNWSQDQILYSLGVFLDHLNPSAADGQKYLITYLLYDNGTNDVTRNLIKTAGEWVWNE